MEQSIYNKQFDLTNQIFSEDNICYVYFVKHEKNSKDFMEDFQKFKDFHDQKNDSIIELIDEERCLKFTKEEIGEKYYIFVFEKFDPNFGAFKHICDMKTVYAIGSKLLLSGLNEPLLIPSSSFHVFSLFMKELHISLASYSREQKQHYKTLITYMGGICHIPLNKHITHLVTEDVFSKKYRYAADQQMDIKILRATWIEESWKYSEKNPLKVGADKEKFYKSHQLKVFNNLEITTTGLTNDEKVKVQKLAEKNGGTFSSAFKTISANVLILTPKDINSVKYKAAQNHNIKCLDFKWMTDSVTIGFTQDPENYKITKNNQIKSSTPTKTTGDVSAIRNFNFDNTMLSEIHENTVKNFTIDETNKLQKGISIASTTISSRASTAHMQPPKASTTFKKPEAPPAKVDDEVVVIPPFESSENSEESFIQILADKIVCIFGFQNDTDSILCIKECEKLGASLVDMNYSKVVDFVIAPSDLILNKEPNMKYKYLLNDVWLEESIDEGRCILPPKFYHYALFYLPEKDKVLKYEIFGCSNYKDRQRPFVKSLIETLGGTLKDSFSNSDPILICEVPQGQKFKAALAWKKTVLKADWLISCFQKRSRVDERNFLIGETKPSLKNIENDAIDDIPYSQEISQENKSSAVQSAPSTPIRNDDEKDAETLSISVLCQDLPTPARDITKAILKENRRQRNENMSPRTKRLKDLLKTPGINADVSSPAPALPSCMKKPERCYGFFNDDSPYTQYQYKCKLAILDEDYVEISSDKKKNLKKICSTPSVDDWKKDFFRRRLPEFDSPMTKENEIESHANMSKEASKFLNFGDTEVISPKRKSNEIDDFSSLEELLKEAQENSAKKAKASERLEYENQQKSAKSFHEEIENENKILIDQHPRNDQINWTSSQVEIPRETSSYRNSSLAFRKLTEIDYDDENAEEMDKPCTKFTEKVNEEEESEEMKENDEEKNSIIFGITCGNVSVETKTELFEKIHQLGAEVSETNFNHLIISKLVRSSKYFSALAAGMKVLHADYLDACLKVQKFVNTDEFEIGNPKFKCKFSGVKDELLLSGPYRCRLLVERNFDKFSSGLFTGKKFLLFTSENRKQGIIDIIESGGGNVVEIGLTVSLLKRENIFMCLADDMKKLSEKEIVALKACDIKIQSTKYIYEHLLTDKIV
ncbi:hypothetical protein PVAND_015875 [Polypedilum vanderplanki]|uniref:BRCT domain-containing protein n=1 Tax=Polypedilum vanderplanki TaxID=319348 RepID=A0A9J6BEF4_POLVA|nr:hypothetical protein PVAND_015875 [Polypedilum vanderplanki]